MKKALNKGFTLIELLVVIAIIGILASVILASLDSARAKGTDAATKSDLDNARAQAEIYYDSTNTSGGTTVSNSYAGVCAAGNTNGGNGINAMLTDAKNKIGGSTTVVTTATTASAWTAVTCHDSAGAWAATVPLQSVGASATSPAYFCVDSNGDAKVGVPSTTTTNEGLTGSGVNQYVCP